MASGVELAGAAHAGAMEHQNPNRLLQEREEVAANPFPTLSRPGNSTNTAADCGAIADPVGARVDGPREHQFAQEKVEEGEGEGDEAHSPA